MAISERATAASRTRLITDDELDKALDWLRDHAAAIGSAKARLIRAERMIGHIEALMTLASAQTSDMKRKADARSSQRYLDAINEEAEAAGEYETMRSLREAAALKIEAWRTEAANYRAMKV